ncbi:polyprenyl synthetase family protein [Paenibacillus terrigena]|uniref:polyprenyl synthetase family protein n=1 Tax=Paenibacillus terrigena TaxID=369333 RepID=UPI00036D3541|nr:polyprenyl synthetase family protein [Paenibacillus terrigena]
MDRLHMESAMKQVIHRHVTPPALRDLMESYVAYKMTESTVFGELTLLHYSMFGGTSEERYAGAAAIEFLVLALDIFDDLQDQDNDRVPWMKHNHAQSMNAAIGFLALSTKVIIDSKFDEARKSIAVELLHHRLNQSVGGQYIDVDNAITEEDECFAMMRAKSGALVACACQLGSVLATGEMNDQVGAYGELFGMSAQLRNDMEGILRWDTRNDLIHRKRTLPVLYLLDDSAPELQVLRDYYAGQATVDQLYANKHVIMDQIERGGCIPYTQVHIQFLQQECHTYIEGLSIDLHWKQELESFI